MLDDKDTKMIEDKTKFDKSIATRLSFSNNHKTILNSRFLSGHKSPEEASPD